MLPMPLPTPAPKHMLMSMSMPELATQVQTGDPVTMCCLQEIQRRPVGASRCESPSWLRPTRKVARLVGGGPGRDC